MLITRFTNDHLDSFSDLLKTRKIHERAIFESPEIGYIALYDSKPIAIGFLRKIEGGFGMLDGFITDPLMSGELRHKALDRILHCLVSEAQKLKMRHLTCFTVDTGTIERGLRNGFEKIPQTMLALKL